MSWNDLSMADRAKYIKLGVSNGITNLSSIRETYNRFDDGGYIGDEDHPILLNEVTVTPQSSALNKSREANKPNTDFSHTQDMSTKSRFAANYLSWIPGFNPRTCINTVTGFYNPNSTVASNPKFVATPEEFGYKEIQQKDIVPGDIIMLSNKDNHPTHAVMFDSVAEGMGIHNGYNYEKGDTLVNYSNGGRNADDYRKQGPLKRFDDPKYSGGDFSGSHRYFRYIGKKKKNNQ